MSSEVNEVLAAILPPIGEQARKLRVGLEDVQAGLGQLRKELEALVQRWRDDAMEAPTWDGDEADRLNRCADELERLIA